MARYSSRTRLHARRQPEGTHGHQPDNPAMDASQRCDKSLQDLANMYNPYIGGWINYYGQFYRAQLRSTLQRIDGYLVRWARRKYKRLRERPKGTRDWLARVRRADPNLFAHWRLVNVGGRTSEAV